MQTLQGLYALLLTSSLLLSACSQPPSLHRHTVFVFGTLVEISIADVDESRAQSAFLELERMLLAMHADWTPWQDSDLSRVNQAIQQNEPFEMPASLLSMTDESIEYFNLSEGMFNPAIGKLIKLWQFHRHEDPQLMPPGPSIIKQTLQHAPAMTDLKQQDGNWRSSNPHVDLNFGAYAKGVAVAAAIAWLKRQGIVHAVVNAGGDLAVSGTNISALPARPWSIGIQHPRQIGVLASIALMGGEAVFTSGDYERYYLRDGRRYHHILDPRTGYPTEHTSSVTVIDDDAAKADAAATALMVAGPDEWYRISRKFGLKYVMLVDDEGTVHMNPAMRERVSFAVHPEPRIVLSDNLYSDQD